MIGDKLIIKPKHRRAAQQIIAASLSEIEKSTTIYTLTVAGESGSGKSETAQAIADSLSEKNIRSLILQQDDYFVLPPRSNDAKRRRDINWVGLQEVRLDLLDEHLGAAIKGATEISKPLVIYHEDRISEETLSLHDVRVVIAEGTYTSILRKVNTKIFIDLSYSQTKKARLERAREVQDSFLEDVLKLEHQIISAHKQYADLIIGPDFDVVPNKPKRDF